MYRIIVRKNYHDSTREYLPGNFLRAEDGSTFGFNSATEVVKHIKEYAGEAIYNDRVLDWWLDISEITQ